MADKVAVVTDSIACLSKGMVERYRVKIIPQNIYFGSRVYREWVDITPDAAYKLFLKNPDGFATSSASPVDYLEAFREASNHTKNILCVTISSKLSTVHNVALLAKEQAKVELPRLSVEVLDSQNVSAAEGFVVLAAARVVEEGKSLNEVVKVAKGIRDRVTLIALMDTVRYVYRSGRIPKLAAIAGSALNIKPIFTPSSGVVRFIGMVRHRERGIERLFRMMRNRVGSSPVHVAVMHAYARSEAEVLEERVLSEFNCQEVWIAEFSPVMGYACGTGTLGLAFYREG